jgi:hypothetical protein
MSHDTVVAEVGEACSKVTVPRTLESPRRTATEGEWLDMRLCSIDLKSWRKTKEGDGWDGWAERAGIALGTDDSQ